jgi:hypothetical protein
MFDIIPDKLIASFCRCDFIDIYELGGQTGNLRIARINDVAISEK